MSSERPASPAGLEVPDAAHHYFGHLSKDDVLDVLSGASIAVVFLGRPTRFDEDQWWVGPIVIASIGWSLMRRGSLLGKWVMAFGLFLFLRGYRRFKAKEAVAKSLA